MITYKNLVIYVILLIIFFAIGYFFRNPHSCVVSDSGCDSIFEMIIDEWSSLVNFFGIMIASIWFFSSINIDDC